MQYLIALLVWFPSLVFAGESAESLIAAGLPPELAPYAAAVSSAEGNFESVNQAGCLGAFQFCPRTFKMYYNGTPEQFLNDPEGQVQAFLRYENDQFNTAQKNGFNEAIGQQVCTTSGCTTITQSSILFACQFGCGSQGKLGNFIANGYQCIPGKGSPTNDGNGVCVATYLARGAGYDVSTISNAPSDAASAGTSPPPNSGSTASTSPPTSVPLGSGISPADAFAAGAGVSMEELRVAILSALAVAMTLWTAWIAFGQYYLWRRGRGTLMDVQTNILKAAGLTLLVLFITLA